MPIRARLTLWYTGILGLTLVAFGVGLYALLGRALMGAMDLGLVDQATRLRRAIMTGPPTLSVVSPRPLPTLRLFGRGALGAPPDVYVQVAGPHRVLLRSWVVLQGDDTGGGRTEGTSSAPTELPMPSQVEFEPRFHTVEVEGRRLRVHEVPLVSSSEGAIWLQVGRPLTEVESAMSTLRWLLVGGGSLALAAAAGVGWWMAAVALGPIGRITRAAHHIGQYRDWRRRVDHSGPRDEVGELASTFNQMLDRLEEAYSRLEEAFQAQRHLLAAASHQLRTPLTIIRGNVELLMRMGDSDPSARREALADVSAEAAYLSHLVSDLLTLARADAGQQLEREPTSLTRALRSAVFRIRTLAAHRNLVATVPETDLMVLGHHTFLEQLFVVLLENAVRYTDSGGEIKVVCRAEEDVATVEVRDNGIGMLPAERERIFDRFYRAPGTKGRPGAGLGLAIAHWIAEQHGVTITVESVPGQGSKFSLRFPVLDVRSGNGPSEVAVDKSQDILQA